MRKISLPLLLLFIIVLVSSCQPTPTTPPVVSKNDGTLEKEIYSGAPEGYVYSAPQSYSMEKVYCDGKVIIKADNCYVNAPKDTTYPVCEAQSKSIDKEFLIGLYKNCFGECEMIMHSTHLTKDEVEQEIIKRKRQLFDIENGQYDPSQYSDDVDYIGEFDEKELIENLKTSISLLEHEKQTAPTETVRAPIKWDEYTDGTSINADVRMSNGKTGRFYYSGNTVAINFDYDMYDTNKNYIKYDTIIEEQGAVMPNCYILGDERRIKYLSDNGDYVPNIDVERAEKYADSFIVKIGLSDTYYKSDIGASSLMQNCYAFCYMRKINDSIGLINDHVSSNRGNATGEDLITQKSFSSPFDYERIVVWANNNGVKCFYYKAPLEIKRVMTDSVVIADFDICANNLTDYIRRQLTTAYDDEDNFYDATEQVSNSNYIEMREYVSFELGYAQVKEKNSDGSYLLVPAWFVSQESSGLVVGKNGKTETDYYGNDCRIYVINAIDGTVIDRNLGY